jgi:hypothetical protein
MTTAERIRHLGFRRWYERTLIEGHAWLVSCFLGIILIACSFEFGQFPLASAEGVLRMGLGLAGGMLTWVAWERYRRILTVAELLSSRAACEACGRYAAFTVDAYGRRSDEEIAAVPAGEDDYPWLKVQCRRCGNRWLL